MDILQLYRSDCYPQRFGSAKDTKILYPPLEKGLPRVGLSFFNVRENSLTHSEFLHPSFYFA